MFKKGAEDEWDEFEEYYKKMARTNEVSFQTTQQRLLWRHATEHFKSVLQPGMIYSCTQAQKPPNLLDTLAGFPTTLQSMETFSLLEAEGPEADLLPFTPNLVDEGSDQYPWCIQL